MEHPRRVLLFGATGQLGSEIARWSDCEIAAPPSEDVDVRDALAVHEAIARSGADTVINCTAFNRVDEAEQHPDRAFAVNAQAVGVMAQAAATADAVFVTFSTDYVFDGALGRAYTEGDAPNPINAYGASKLEGERRALAGGGRVYVLRTCGLYGRRTSSSKGYNFVERILAQAMAGETLRVVSDQIVSPTYAGDLADATRALLRLQPEAGVYHAVNEGPVSWYEFAVEILERAGLTAPIDPMPAEQWNGATNRPAFSALSNDRLKTIGVLMPRWNEALYVSERHSDDH